MDKYLVVDVLYDYLNALRRHGTPEQQTQCEQAIKEVEGDKPAQG